MPNYPVVAGVELKPWHPNATPDEVRRHIINLQYVVLSRFRDAALVNDFPEMDRMTKEFRALATHLDAYRRMKARAHAENGARSNDDNPAS